MIAIYLVFAGLLVGWIWLDVRRALRAQARARAALRRRSS